MLDIFVRIHSLDLQFDTREFQPTKEMEEQYVRVTNVDTIPEQSGAPGYQLFYGIIVDANGDDVPEGTRVILVDHEIDSYCNMPTLFGCKRERNA